MLFYAPERGMAEARERGRTGPAVLLAFLAQSAYDLYWYWPLLSRMSVLQHTPFAFILVFIRSAVSLLIIALVLVPVTILVANLFERRAGFALAVRQEYASVATTVFYAWAAAHLVALPLAVLNNMSGFEATWLRAREAAKQFQYNMGAPGEIPPEVFQILSDFLTRLVGRVLLSPYPFFGIWAVVAVREVFRLSWLRALATLSLTGLLMIVLLPLLGTVFGFLFASPFLLLLLFFVLRGYAAEVMGARRARVSCKQSLEAASLNPADASARYNLGLIYLQRREPDEARKCFERAIEIDPDEVDAHYQLGRMSRAQNALADAIKHFEQVVAREPQHAQHEIWREIGATYLAAGQFADAYDALGRFLEHRTSDPEGLYLMGRALAGMGRRREALDSMRACIEAVKTAPAYKYRTEKRWLNEAQQFLRTQA